MGRSREELTVAAAVGSLLLSVTEPFLTPAGLLSRKVPAGSRSTYGTNPTPLDGRMPTGNSARGDAAVVRGGNGWRWRLSSRVLLGAVGLPEGDEGIADLESLDNPAKEKDYGEDNSLQYGVSSAIAGAADQFFSADTRVVFGVNALEIGLVELYDMGLQRALIVTGWNQARADPIVWELLPRGFDLKWHSVSAEPSVTDVANGASLALEHRADCVVAMGGASVIDAAKAIAAIAYVDKDSHKAARRLLVAARQPRVETEEEGADLAPLLGPVPLVAIPVVAGVGSEITPMATLLDDEDPLEPKKITVGFHSTAAAMPAPFMAMVEPRLMMRVPLDTMWPRAFVALAGCLEGYLAGRGFVPDLLSHQGIERVSRCLSKELGFRGPLYPEREDIAFAGVIRGLVASRTEWSFLHKLASAVSVASGAPYAVCIARLFPRVLEAQISMLRLEEGAYTDAARRRKPAPRTADNADSELPEVIVGDLPGEDDEDWEPRGSGSRQRPGDGSSAAAAKVDDNYACTALLKYKRVASFVTGSGRSTPEDIVSWLDARLLDKNVAPLYRTGLRPEHVSSIVEDVLMEGGEGEPFGGLGEAKVKAIVVAEATRPGSSGATTQGEVERVQEVEVMPPKTGPWQKR